MVALTKVGRATTTAVRSMLVLGASQKPRNITLPVILATNTWPSSRMLIASANPVAKVSNNNAVIKKRSDTGEVTAMGCSTFRSSLGVRLRPTSLHVRRQIQRGNGRHPGHQPAPVRTFHEEPVGEVFQRRDVLGQWAGGRGVGVHHDDSVRIIQRLDRYTGDLGAVGYFGLLVGGHDRVHEFAVLGSEIAA